jgi:hypothetical protein
MFVEWKKLSQVNGWCGCIEDLVEPSTSPSVVLFVPGVWMPSLWAVLGAL